MAFRCKAGSSWLCSALSFSVDGSALSWGIALSFLPLSLSLVSSSSFLGVGGGWAEPGDTSGGGEGDCVWRGWGCAVDGGEGSCHPPRTLGDVAHLDLASLLGHLFYGGLGRGRFPHASAPLVTAGASPQGGKEEASTVSSPPLETQCWGGDGPAPASHPGTWGTRHPPRLVWAQEGNVCAGLRPLCGDRWLDVAGETSWASVPSLAGCLLLLWVGSAIVFDLGDAMEIAGSPLIVHPGELWDSGLDARRTTPPRVSRALQEAPFSAPLSVFIARVTSGRHSLGPFDHLQSDGNSISLVYL